MKKRAVMKTRSEKDDQEGHEGHDEHGESGSVKMTAEVQKENGVVVAPAKKQRLAGVISATGKVEANADRIAHVSPRISGKIVSRQGLPGGQRLRRAGPGDPGQRRAGRSLSRYHQSKTKLALAQSNMERIKTLVEKKIAARKDILQAETDFKTAQTELHTDEERLSLYGVSTSDLEGESHKRPLLPVRSPIGGIITEKHAIVGELSDPSKSLYTVADLSIVWVLVDINEKDLAKVRKGQAAHRHRRRLSRPETERPHHLYRRSGGRVHPHGQGADRGCQSGPEAEAGDVCHCRTGTAG